MRTSLLLLLALLAPALLAQALPEIVRLNEEGITHLTERRPRKAVDAFEAARKQLPDNRILKRNLAASLAALAERRREAKQPAAAVKLLDRAVELHPERLRYRVLRGRAHYEAGEGAQRFFAQQDFLFVLRQDPDHLDALVNLGHIHYLERRLEEGVRLWRRAAEFSPKDKDIRSRLAKAERELAVEASYHELRSAHFVVRHGKSVPSSVAETVLSICGSAWDTLCRRFQHWPDGTTVVTLYSPAEFRSATRVHAWVAGLSDGTIRLTVRSTDRAANLRATLFHEFTHHIVRRIAPRAPEWLHEGLAQMAEPRSRKAAEARLRRTPNVKAQTLSERILGQSDARRVSTLYDLALSFTHYLHDLSGDRGIHEMLDFLKQGKDEAAAFQGVFGRSRDEIFAEWQRRPR